MCALPVFVAPTPVQASPPTVTRIHKFTGAISDGANPYGGLVVGSSGVIYGTTTYGGTANLGTVFSLTPPSSPGGQWAERVLYSFLGGSDGAIPYYTPLAIGAGGVLYGTTSSGGASDSGTVFALTPPATLGGNWTESVLYSFAGDTDGAAPYGGVVIGNGGVLYGTTTEGGNPTFGGYGAGTVFSLTPPASPGGTWTEDLVYVFAGYDDGDAPYASLTLGTGGVLYGTTDYGGTWNVGTVFSLTPPVSPGGAWTKTLLYTFTGLTDGAWPLAGVTLDSAGNLYGTTQGGGLRAAVRCTR